MTRCARWIGIDPSKVFPNVSRNRTRSNSPATTSDQRNAGVDTGGIVALARARRGRTGRSPLG